MIITLTGKNDFACQQELARLVSTHKSTYGDITLHQFEGDSLNFDQLSEAVLAMPFLASQSMVVLRDVASTKAIHDQLIQLIDKVPETTQLIISDPKLDKRGALYKVLQSKSDLREYKPLDERQLIDWVQKRFEEANRPVERSILRHFVQRAGEDQWRLNSEIDKLINFEREINLSLINDVVEPHPRETIFQLLDSVSHHQQRQALDLYKSLITARMEPMYILSMLIWQLNNMSIVVAAGKKTDNEIMADIKISPYVLSKTRQAVRNISLRTIKSMWNQVLAADLKVKSSSVNDELLIEQLIVKLATS